MKTLKIATIFFLSLITVSCSSDDSGSTNSVQELLVGRWLRESTQDANGNVTNNTGSCLITEFTQNTYTVSDFNGPDCSEFVSSESSSYIISAFDIYLNGNQEIDFKIVELNDTTLKLRVFNSELSEGDAQDTITYSKLE